LANLPTGCEVGRRDPRNDYEARHAEDLLAYLKRKIG
jgi:hypothetical protein